MNDNLSKVKYLMNNYQYSIEDAGLNGRNSLIFHVSGDKLIDFLTTEISSDMVIHQENQIFIDTSKSFVDLLIDKNGLKYQETNFFDLKQEDLIAEKIYYVGLRPLFGIVNLILFYKDINDLKEDLFNPEIIARKSDFSPFAVLEKPSGLIYCNNEWFSLHEKDNGQKRSQEYYKIEKIYFSAMKLFNKYHQDKKRIYDDLVEQTLIQKNYDDII